jgi:hypothetical protein
MSVRKGGRVKQFIIDSDVIASATEKQEKRAILCRQLLLTMYSTQHEVLLTPGIKREWENRYPGFAQSWAVKMKQKGLLIEIEQDPESGLAAQIQALEVVPTVAAIMLKDCHLLEAAFVAGKAIFSQDDSAYVHFYDASDKIPRLQNVMWANPERPEDNCVEWLKPGARQDDKRCIGRRPKRGIPPK